MRNKYKAGMLRNSQITTKTWFSSCAAQHQSLAGHWALGFSWGNKRAHGTDGQQVHKGSTENVLSWTCQAYSGNCSTVYYMKPWKQNAAKKAKNQPSSCRGNLAYGYNTYQSFTSKIILREEIKSKQGDKIAVSLHQTRETESKRPQIQLLLPGPTSQRHCFVLLHPCLCSAWAGTSICSALQWARPGELIQAITNLANMNYSTGAGMHSQGSGKGKISSLSSSTSRGQLKPTYNNGVRVCTSKHSCYHSRKNS